MKKYYFTLCYLFLSLTSFGQQYLWSTAENTSSKHIPIAEVSNEILKFYDHYDFYYDGTGYNKDTFFKEIEKYGGNTKGWNDFKNEVKKIENLTVLAIRANSGNGSFIMTIFITKDNINILVFTNSLEQGAQSCASYERDKFESWLETLKE